MEDKRCGGIGRKINKNAKEFNVLYAYGKMTPEEMHKAIQTALNAQRNELNALFNKEFTKLENEYNRSLKINFTNVIDIISVELLYELADQMNYWDLKVKNEDDQYVKDSIKIRIQEIFENTMNKIQGYADMKYERMANKEFEDKKKKIQREFGIKF